MNQTCMQFTLMIPKKGKKERKNEDYKRPFLHLCTKQLQQQQQRKFQILFP